MIEDIKMLYYNDANSPPYGEMFTYGYEFEEDDYIGIITQIMCDIHHEGINEEEVKLYHMMYVMNNRRPYYREGK